MALPRSLLASLIVGSALALSACTEAGQTEIARGNVFASRKQLDAALTEYAAAATAAPTKARPRELKGHVLFDLGRFPEARASYEEAVRVEPEAALEARIGLARLDAESGKLDDAMKELDQVLGQRKDNLYALLSRANLAVRRGGPADPELAIQDTAKAMQIDPRNASVLYTRGCAFIGARQLDNAEEAFRLLDAAHPGTPMVAYGRARLASARGDRLGTLAQLREARDRSSKTHDLAGGWKPAEIRADPAFRSLKDDPDFASVVGS